MLILPIQKQWYDMILSGEKKEEYREIKPYYTTRFSNAGLLEKNINHIDDIITRSDFGPLSDDSKRKLSSNCPDYDLIAFRNGYGKDKPTFIARVEIDIKEGNPDWGAVSGVKYYCLKIKEII